MAADYALDRSRSPSVQARVRLSRLFAPPVRLKHLRPAAQGER